MAVGVEEPFRYGVCLRLLVPGPRSIRLIRGLLLRKIMPGDQETLAQDAGHLAGDLGEPPRRCLGGSTPPPQEGNIHVPGAQPPVASGRGLKDPRLSSAGGEISPASYPKKHLSCRRVIPYPHAGA
ncbi:MAG: hypothetical protein SF053_09575 [Bacteroidia bacterium]|nr:hypothetical protein [Bacteroidia bacterium]